MKTLAAVRINHYRRAVAALRASTRTLELAAQAVLTVHPELINAALEPQGGALAVVVFGSERGLCGAFNERIARHAAGLIASRGEAGRVSVLTVGRRAEASLREHKIGSAASVRPPGSVDAITGAVVEVLKVLDEWLLAGRAARLYLAYNAPARGASYESVAVRVVPVSQRWLLRLRERAWPTRRLPMLLGDEYALVQGLVRQFVAHALVQAFAASLASENAARLEAMSAAESNIEERLERLTAAHRQARQNAVTAELLDIQAAADAAP